MKELVKISRVSGMLEKMYRQLNQDKFNGELEDPIITINLHRGHTDMLLVVRYGKARTLHDMS